MPVIQNVASVGDLFLMFGLAPILYTGWVSLFRWNPIGKQEFIGLGNYQTILTDRYWWTALAVTLAGWLGTRGSARASPLAVIRQLG